MVGVIPTFISDDIIHSQPVSELVRVRTLAESKEYLIAHSDAFVALPGGIDFSAELGRQDAYAERTAELLDGVGTRRAASADDTAADSGRGTPRPYSVILFEAGFQYDDVLVLADVVCQREDGSLDIYEVKSGTTLSDTYRRDAALQHYVISHCRTVHNFSIVYNGTQASSLREEYEDQMPTGRRLEACVPFVIVDLTEELAAEGDRIAANIAEMKTIVRATAEPDTPTGQHCLTPYACPYQHHCQQGVRQLALF